MTEEQQRKSLEVSRGKGTARPRGTDSAKVIEVIETRSLLGRGTDEDPVRTLRQYWDFDGRMLAQSED